MDVAALAATLVNAKAQTAMQDAQVGVLKRAMDTQAGAALRLLDSMTLPPATEGRIGTNVNLYA